MDLEQYQDIIKDLKEKFKSHQIKAAIKINSELLEFYWYLGQKIVELQDKQKWGSKFLENLSRDLSKEFPNIKGFSYRNVRAIRQWYLFWQQAVSKMENKFVKQVVSQIYQIPWGHNIAIIQKCKNIDEAIFYVQNTIKNGISRSVLIHQIESDLYRRNKNAINNFDSTLPPVTSDMAKEITKDSYIFDFLTINDRYGEKELENALIDNIKEFLLELGNGFAFVGKQYKLIINEKEFRIDLLFYHLKLHSYIVIELKTTEFKPEFAGKLNFYVSAVDSKLRSKEDNQTIGILICKEKDNLIVEYAIKDINKPIGVSEYQLTKELPKNLKEKLPSCEDFKKLTKRMY